MILLVVGPLQLSCGALIRIRVTLKNHTNIVEGVIEQECWFGGHKRPWIMSECPLWPFEIPPGFLACRQGVTMD